MMSLSTIFSSVSQLAGIVTLLMVIVTLYYTPTGRISLTSSVELNEPLSTSNNARSTSSATHCPWLRNMTTRRRSYVAVPIDPPWMYLLANYSSTENLYLWHCNPQRHRKFGNQLFNMAAVFGVAWRNRRIPLWPSHNTHVSAFQHRLIIDKTLQRDVRTAASLLAAYPML